MRRLAAVGITTREACGNSVRNVTACPLSGVCRDEVFDVTPYAKASAKFMMGHPDAQGFGRKFKIALSGCKDKACALVNMHDLGLIAKTRTENGRQAWLRAVRGGGLGAVPQQAKLFDDFCPKKSTADNAGYRESLRPTREEESRGRTHQIPDHEAGIDEFRRLVEERKTLPQDPRWPATCRVPKTTRRAR
jgi:sulfite reductase (ferredoxin)